MKIVAVVPIKLNNERLPGKNIKSFKNGKPLCQYILNTLLDIKEIDEIYVYCYNDIIQDYLPKGIKYLKIPKKIYESNVKMNDILASFAKDVPADIYVMTHATSPFVKSKSISYALGKVISNEYDSAFAVKVIQDFLWKDNKPINYKLENIPRTQDLDPIYQETSGFYIYKSEIITKYNRRIGFYPFLQKVDEIESVDIDEMIDFQIADSIYNNLMR